MKHASKLAFEKRRWSGDKTPAPDPLQVERSFRVDHLPHDRHYEYRWLKWQKQMWELRHSSVSNNGESWSLVGSVQRIAKRRGRNYLYDVRLVMERTADLEIKRLPFPTIGAAREYVEGTIIERKLAATS